MTLARQILIDSPGGYWPLDEASGTITDRSGNGRDASGTSGTVTLGTAAVVPGMTSVTLTSGSFVTLPDAAVSMTADFSMEIWVVVTSSLSGIQAVFGKDQDSSNIAGLFYVNGTSPRVEMKAPGGSGNTTTVGPTLTGNVIQQLVFTVASNIGTVYVNGVAGSTQTLGATHRNNTTTLRIGASADTFWGGAAGRFSNAAVYPTALTAARVQAHFAAGIREGGVFG